jgi:hypothetical protein
VKLGRCNQLFELCTFESKKAKGKSEVERRTNSAALIHTRLMKAALFIISSLLPFAFF